MLSEFERKAWDNRSEASQHKPEFVLRVVQDDIERGKLDGLRHIIVVTVRGLEDGDSQFDRIQIHQAGDLSILAVEGALGRALMVHRDEGGVYDKNR